MRWMMNIVLCIYCMIVDIHGCCNWIIVNTVLVSMLAFFNFNTNPLRPYTTRLTTYKNDH